MGGLLASPLVVQNDMAEAVRAANRRYRGVSGSDSDHASLVLSFIKGCSRSSLFPLIRRSTQDVGAGCESLAGQPGGRVAGRLAG